MIRNPNDIQDGAKKIRMLIAGYPETNCQGLFNQVYKEVTFCGLHHGADA